jgi:hypothetical protein
VTTLREARDQILALEQQRLTFLTRKGRGELVRRHAAENFAATLVRDARDRAQLLPHRHAAILAARYRVEARAVHSVLTRLRGLGVFSTARPLSINGLVGKVCTTGGGVGRWRSAVAAEVADLA